MYKNYCNQLEQQNKQDKMGEVAELWAKLDGSSDCKSILKKCLTKEIYEQLKDKKTSLGGTLADCIRSGEKFFNFTSFVFFIFFIFTCIFLPLKFALKHVENFQYSVHLKSLIVFNKYIINLLIYMVVVKVIQWYRRLFLYRVCN